MRKMRVCARLVRCAVYTLCLWTMNLVDRDVNPCLRSLTLSNPLALVCDPTRDEVVDQLGIQHGALQQQVGVLQKANSKLNIARAQAPTRRMLVDQQGLGKPPVFFGKEEDFCVWANFQNLHSLFLKKCMHTKIQKYHGTVHVESK